MLPLNMGLTDRVLRGMAGLFLAALPPLGVVGGAWAVLTYFVAALLLVTAVVAYSPLYSMLHWSTRGKATPRA